MPRSQLSPLVLTALAAVVSISCRTETIEYEPGDNLTYYSSPTLTPCAGTPEDLDNYVSFLRREFAFEEAPDPELQYRWLTAGAFSREVGREIVGIAMGRVSRSRDPSLPHELVHSLLDVYGYSSGGSFFDEGIASFYNPGGEMQSLGRVLAGDGLWARDRELWSEVFNIDYTLAGTFTAFLLYRYGPKKFLALIRRLGPWAANRPLVEQNFYEVYGRDIEEEFLRFRRSSAEEICSEEGFPMGLYECTVGDPEPLGIEWTRIWSATCDDEESLGGVGSDYYDRIFVRYTFEVEEETEVRFQLIDRSGTAVVGIGSCGPCPFMWSHTHFDKDEPIGTLVLEKGVHYVQIMIPEEPGNEIAIQIVPLWFWR